MDNLSCYHDEKGVHEFLREAIALIQDQKQEIELFSKVISSSKRKTKILELRKEIERLTEEKEDLYFQNQNLQTYIDNHEPIWERNKEQAVKDTVKEIYGEINDSDILVVQTQEYGEIEVVPIERLKEIIKQKGVEVE